MNFGEFQFIRDFIHQSCGRAKQNERENATKLDISARRITAKTCTSLRENECIWVRTIAKVSSK
jgi:hypothetical protein